MSTDNPSQKSQTAAIESAIIVLVVCVVAWPAVLAAIITRLLIKRTSHPTIYWASAGGLGLMGTMLLVLQGNILPVFQAELYSLVPLLLHMSQSTAMHFLAQALPMWERSLFVFPLLALVLNLFQPKRLQDQLAEQEKHHQRIQTHKGARAAKRVQHAPSHIKGQAVLGALIEERTGR